MKSLPIKPFSFVDYIDKDWPQWKDEVLFEAMARAKDKASYAFAGNQSKAPILWDADDWKYLTQFPPELWTRALLYRYNLGLIRASQLRMEDPNKSLEAVPNYVEALEFHNKDGTKYVFKNVYVGFRDLIERLEKPVRVNRKHNTIPGVQSPDDPGIDDIDPHQADSAHPQHRSKYKYGLHDFDLTYPVEMSDEYIDAIPDEEINLPPGQDRTPENLRKKREAMKAAAQHSFAGMSVLQPVRASTHMGNWYRAMGLGLLGKVPDKIKDPHTNEEIDVQQGVSPTVINPDWASHVGQADGSQVPYSVGEKKGTVVGRLEPILVPAIKRRLNFEVHDAAGNTQTVDREYQMPVLLPGKILPRVANLSPEQRKILAKRSGFDLEKNCGGKGVSWTMPWDEVETKCKAAKQAGQADDLANLLRNYDILTPEQRLHLLKNQRDAYHYVKSSRGSGKKDPYAGELNYAIGFRPNKQKRGLVPMDLPKEKMKEVADKYYKVLWEDADRGVSYFINWAKKYGKLHSDVIKVMEKIHTDLSNVAAAFLVMNINHPKLGVHDPEMGLTNVPADADEKILKATRKLYAFNFARDLSQAAFGDVGSRRQREKMLHGGEVSIDAPLATGKEGDQAGLAQNLPQGEGGTGAENLRQWYTRRLQLNPKTEPVIDSETGAATYPIARLIWNVPKIDHAIDRFFETRRNMILSKLGGDYASMVDKLRDKMKTEMDALKELYDDAVKELLDQGLSDEEIEVKAKEIVRSRLKDKLLQMRPDLYGDMSDKDLENILAKIKDVTTQVHYTPEIEAEEAEYMEEFWSKIVDGEEWPVPFYNPSVGDFVEGPTVSIATFANYDAASLVNAMIKAWNAKGAAKWAVRVWMAVNKHNGTPITEEKAVQDITNTGIVVPEEANKYKSDTPATTTPPTKKKPFATMTIGSGAQPKAAATDVTGLFTDLKSNWQQIIARKDELPAVADAFRTALQQFRASLQQKRSTGGTVGLDELTALVKLGNLADQLGIK